MNLLKLIFLNFKIHWLLLLIFSFTQNSQADSDVRLITIGPGDAFWSAYGHTALAIGDRVYGFGYFSFEDENLIQSFISNQMFYDIGVSDFSDELAMAEWQNRTFIVQDLFLDSIEQQQMADYLVWHNLPENQSYRYDYFVNNCATKIRDILDQAWHGQIKQRFHKPTNQSYFSLTFPANKQALMNFGIVLGYGWPAYEKRTAWELMAFPVYLQSVMSQMPNTEVSGAQVLYEADQQAGWQNWLLTHWFIWAYTIIISLALKIKMTRRISSHFVFASQLTLGLVIVYFWLFSGHEITQWNFNVLLFSPMVMLLLFSPIFKWLVLVGYLSWAIIAMILQAWYFAPILLLHVYWLLQQYYLSKRTL